ncbi:MAG: bifunctional diaminohydroxyphosphoribosylaminopyrimidine deaminase/5-amino-6-(5-phosphoribosylamino)uracil reductase RibD [Cytophagaceae bacterium]|jgi:diaminohydroxyphosphoribosylaminopyrimidine deaminase/5-amino-6-(5-phosphoribosylamino)uracil reductase|nr:bifunctional diaminohydroxyphosphoribosylaminopyrimidine deaminase/5-amino-6-(5-phosphoribosylamino)uracil reductase RibD [Cytophagaceae bacterium]
MNADERYMRRALELAQLGLGSVSPNPLVGCVIVKDDKIIAEGYHKTFGQAHAEVEAIKQLPSREAASGATLYVNLEPCSHTGKTPPCVDLITQYPFQRIVFANIDPNPLVAGAGFEKLMGHGFEVTQGVLEHEARQLNKRFFTFMEKKRPYIILKWAETADGFIARDDYSSKWISNEVSRRLTHKWRSEEDVVLVGTNTALYDNPQLNVRDWTGRHPVRAFIDKTLQLPQAAHLLDGTQTTICYNYQEQYIHNLVDYVKLDPVLDTLDQILEDLYTRRLGSILVEGGSVLLKAFIQKNLWDEIRVFTAPVTFHSGIEAPSVRRSPAYKEQVLTDELKIYYNQ